MTKVYWMDGWGNNFTSEMIARFGVRDLLYVVVWDEARRVPRVLQIDNELGHEIWAQRVD